MGLEGWIREKAAQLGIDEIGFADAGPDIAVKFPKAKSVICAAECYLVDDPPLAQSRANPAGSVARYTRSNYYYDLRKRLQALGAALREKTGKTGLRAYSGSPYREKPYAVKVGIGWYGKNAIIQTKTHGSWVVLGELITPLRLEPGEPIENGCGSCSACQKACPTGALHTPYSLERKKCLQHILNELRALTGYEKQAWGNRLYGCTTCQDCCPKNRVVIPRASHPERGFVGPSVPLVDVLRLSEPQYRDRFKNNQMGASWIDFCCMQRNALTALGNIQKGAGRGCAGHAEAKRLSSSPDPAVQEHALWAVKMMEK